MSTELSMMLTALGENTIGTLVILSYMLENENIYLERVVNSQV